MADETSGDRFMPRLGQETIAIIGAGVTVPGIGVATIAACLSVADGLRAEMRADRADAQEDRKAIRAEARADRERFERQILRLIRGQGILFGLIEGRSQERDEAGDAPDGAPPAESRDGAPEVGNRPAAPCGDTYGGAGLGSRHTCRAASRWSGM